ncbi:hypothetical protein ACO22_07186 [Paracoccidioides brasiliensis]|uniref:Uncharacterized protein n=1 Tax=Paracoccidioides brasiliensis TaxID=121759 RepID=A0A1D2J5S2_PARBR|nr:hypothetical protein ACO22_07186 [Paracoccidioides brasiliensis]
MAKLKVTQYPYAVALGWRAHTSHSKAVKPARILARLPADHPARKASPIAILEKLRTELAEPLAAAIKKVQHNPTRITIAAHNPQSVWPSQPMGRSIGYSQLDNARNDRRLSTDGLTHLLAFTSIKLTAKLSKSKQRHGW